MAIAPAQEKNAQPTPRSAWRRARKPLMLLALIVLAALVGCFIWASWRYHQLVSLGKRAAEGYGALERAYPFRSPDSSAAIGAGRWDAMLRARQALLGAVSPRVRQALDRTLTSDRPDRLDLLLAWLAATEDLGRAMDAHMSALRREQMSPGEYQWLLGLAMREAMEKSRRYPAGEDYWHVVRQIERLSQYGGRFAYPVTAGQAYELLNQTYRGVSLDKDDVIERLGSQDKSQGQGKSAYMIDWLAVVAKWAAPI